MTRQVAVVATGLLVIGTTPSAQSPSGPTFGTDTSAIVVDVVVRDRQGRPITDLALKDFQLLEDGVVQEIGAMSMIAPEVAGVTHEKRRVYNTGISQEAAAGIVERTAAEGEGVSAQTIAAIVFERLTPESRRDAMKAALAYFETPERPDDLVGVFLIDLRLETLQTFTNDRRKVRAAIEAAAERPTSFQNVSREGAGTGARPIVGASTRGGDMEASRFGASTMQDVERKLEEDFRAIENLQRGHASLAGLDAIVGGLALLPGRKTVVYFSDNLPLTTPGSGSGRPSAIGGDGLRQRFQAVIDRANAANVSVYPVDTVGLRAHSQELANGQGLTEAARSSLNSPDGSNGMAMATGLEITQAGSTSHVFGRLAKETGGFVIESTNDLAAGLRRVDADRRFHYLLTYTPRKTEFGGEYRQIEVRVSRRNAVVRARSGYRADRALATIPTQRYEVMAAAALAATPRPADIPVEARALRMPAADDAGRVAVLVRVLARGITFQSDRVLGRYRTDAVVLARILDESGSVVRKASQPYRLDGPLAERDAAAEGDLVFFRQPTLPPGRYTMEYAVVDALGNRAGTGSIPLDIVESTPSMLVASDLIVAQRAEAVKVGEIEPNHALLVAGKVLLYPNLGESLRADTEQTVTLYAVVRPAAGRRDVTASLAVVRNRQTVVTATVTMAKAGEDGFIRQLIRLPLPALAADRYAIRLDLSDGQNRTARTARIDIR